MTDASARHTPQPFKVSMPYAVGRIMNGLAWDETQIAFPTIVATLGFWIAQFPSLVRDVLARNRLIGAIKYMSNRRTTTTAAAGGGAATGAESATAEAAGAGAGGSSAGGGAAAPAPTSGRAPSSRGAKKV